MNARSVLTSIFSLAILVAAPCRVSAKSNPIMLMQRPAEQSAIALPRLPDSGFGRAVGAMFPQSALVHDQAPMTAPTPILDQIEQTIRQANIGEPSLRNPVPQVELDSLRSRFAEQGLELTPRELRAAVDYAHALLRENPDAALLEKVVRDQQVERPGLHGNVAELAEARERDMVLTRDPQSEHYDLTESKVGARSAQVKIYKDANSGLISTIDDLKNLPEGAPRYGIMPRESLRELESRGVVSKRTINGTDFFIPHDEPTMKIMASQAFEGPGESVDYAATGRDVLAKLEGLGPEEGWAMAGGKVMGLAGVAVTVGFEGYSVYEWSIGHLSTRQLLISSTALGGGAAGGYAGALAGGAAGGFGGALAGGAMGAAAGSVVPLEGYYVYEWSTGHLSTRKFVTSSAALGGGAVGGYAGALAGGAVGAAAGSVVPLVGTAAGAVVGAVVGATIGGTAGGWAGSDLAAGAVGSYYQFEDGKFGRHQQAELMRFLTKYYADKTGSATK